MHVDIFHPETHMRQTAAQRHDRSSSTSIKQMAVNDAGQVLESPPYELRRAQHAEEPRTCDLMPRVETRMCMSLQQCFNLKHNILFL
jgi:hypothetical protein